MNYPAPRHSSLMAVLLTPIAVCNTAVQASHFTEREVTFPNGTVVLAGTLLLPNEEGSHPTVVFLHGSGPATRAGARSYAERFAKLGIASLILDKRGTGSSGGSWLTCSLDDLAQDALAAVRFVKTQDGVDGKRIGFWGVSQAGWVATLAASQSADVGFMILISGGGATPRESEEFSYHRAFDRAGLTTTEKADASKALSAYFRYLATGDGRDDLVQLLESAKDRRWYPYAKLDRILPSEQNRRNWSWVSTWDPAPHIAKISCPVLLMFGDLDSDHPTSIAVTKWQEGLKIAGNDKVTLMVFPGAGHGIRMREGFTGKGRPPFAAGYSESMIGWLWTHVLIGETQGRR